MTSRQLSLMHGTKEKNLTAPGTAQTPLRTVMFLFSAVYRNRNSK